MTLDWAEDLVSFEPYTPQIQTVLLQEVDLVFGYQIETHAASYRHRLLHLELDCQIDQPPES